MHGVAHGRNPHVHAHVLLHGCDHAHYHHDYAHVLLISFLCETPCEIHCRLFHQREEVELLLHHGNVRDLHLHGNDHDLQMQENAILTAIFQRAIVTQTPLRGRGNFQLSQN